MQLRTKELNKNEISIIFECYLEKKFLYNVL